MQPTDCKSLATYQSPDNRAICRDDDYRKRLRAVLLPFTPLSYTLFGNLSSNLLHCFQFFKFLVKKYTVFCISAPSTTPECNKKRRFHIGVF